MSLRKISILSITASDSTGYSGMQADVKTISELGGHPVSTITAISTDGSLGMQHVSDLPLELIINQVQSVLESNPPHAIKIGMVREAKTIQALGTLLSSYTTPLVCAPGILTSSGHRLANDEATEAFKQHLIPQADLLVLRCNEAEILLNTNIRTDDDMHEAALALHRMGARWVMLRGGLQTEGRCTALLLSQNYSQFFVSYNIEGWQQHGVGGALTAAIATRLAFGDDMTTAITKAHDYIHSQVVYAISPDAKHLRPSDIYNQLLSLIAQNYKSAHDVTFYAEKLAISTRYLSQLTNKYVGKSPKQVIADYLIQEAKILLETSRLTIQEISLRLGFPNQSAFSKFFSSQIGKSPSQYRML